MEARREVKVAELFKNGSKCEEAIQMFSLFSNRNRFKILCVLNEGDFCVNEIVGLVGGTLSNVSQQLKILTLAGYIKKQRKERSVYYSLADDRIRRLLQFLYQQYSEVDQHADADQYTDTDTDTDGSKEL